MLNAAILSCVVLVGAILIWPRVANSVVWRATITPLASIIGSGFLVLGPILAVSYGGYAPPVMIALCAAAYLFGSALWFNIADIDSNAAPSALVLWLDSTASIVLAFAYIVSVASYLNLFGSFGVSLTDFNDSFHANLLTTAVLMLILFTRLNAVFWLWNGWSSFPSGLNWRLSRSDIRSATSGFGCPALWANASEKR